MELKVQLLILKIGYTIFCTIFSDVMQFEISSLVYTALEM